MPIKEKVKSVFIGGVRSESDRAFRRISSAQDASVLLERRKLRAPLSVAFVKQSSYVDLYTLPTFDAAGRSRTSREVYCSSNFRSGPAGLLAHFDCDFIIVNCDDAPECKIWECRLPQEAKRDEVTVARRARKRKEQESSSVDASSVDWSKYDLVVCMENAVPSSITSKYPETLWATMLEWFGMPQYKRYLFRPPDGYDVFLTQFFSSTPFDFMLPDSALHWPYGLLHSSSFSELGLVDSANKKDTIVLDRNAESIRPSLQNERQFSDRLDTLGGLNIREFVERVSGAKYYTSLGVSRLLWGNGTLDIAALGSLILTDRSTFINSAIVSPDCHVVSIEDLVRKLKMYDADQTCYDAALDNQRKRLDYFAFWRPLLELHAFAKKKGRFPRVADKLEELFEAE